jgi:UTP-glucose-1-phosphate uridylyltransferase
MEKILPATKALANKIPPIVDASTIQYIIQEAVDRRIE